MSYFETKGLAVGYHGKALIQDISFEIPKGKILTLIGPNGAGKSTILKSLTRHLTPISGNAYLEQKEISKWTNKEFARKTAVMLTERVRPELMTCAEVVAMGRYAYTNMFDTLSAEDKRFVEKSLDIVHATELAERDFSTLSDGQRQRVLLARAICQQPEVLVLDEPTAYLDIRYKVELLEILRAMSHKEGMTVIVSLHEIDMAMKISDLLLCVKGDRIAAFGTPEEVLGSGRVEALYDMELGSYDALFGSVELKKPIGKPEVFVIAGGGHGIPCFRSLQKQEIPFATGILFENDLDYPVAKSLSNHVVSAPAFSRMSEKQYEEAAALLLSCAYVWDAGTKLGELNQLNGKLSTLAKERGISNWEA